MKNIVLIVLCMVFLGSCGDSTLSQPESMQSTVYFPLQIGNTWKYCNLGEKVPTVVLIATVTSTIEINGKTYFVVTQTPKNERYFPEYLRVENDKIYKYQEDKEMLYIDFSINQSNVCGKVDTTEERVESRIGTLHNVKYVSFPGSGADAEPYNTYAPNVGLITTGYEGPTFELMYAKIGEKVYQ